MQLIWEIKDSALVVQLLVDDGNGEGGQFVESEMRIPLLPDGRIDLYAEKAT